MNLFILKLKFTRLLRYFKKGSTGKLITAGLFFLVFFGVAFGIFKFFLSGFSYLHNFPYFEPALFLYSFELFFLLLGFLAWFGSIISLLFGLFKSKSQLLYLISPKFNLVPKNILTGSLISSTWMFLFLIFPALLAAKIFYSFSLFTFLTIIVTSILLLITVILLAYCSIMIPAHILHRLKILSFKNLSLFIGIIVASCFFVIGSKFSHHDIIVTLSVENLKISSAPTQPVLSLFHYLPSSTASQAVLFAKTGDVKNLGSSVVKLVQLLILLVALCVFVSKKFLLLWQNLAEGHHVAYTKNSHAGAKLTAIPLPNGGFQGVLYKEVILLFRNTKNLFWLLFLGILWLSYIGFNFSLQRRLASYSYTLPGLPKIILALQLMILVYFVSAMVLRFAFPSFSAEKNTIWIFSSTPLSFKKLLWAKFLFFSSVFSLFSIAVELFNVFILHLELGSGGMFLWLSLCAALFISALGLFFGARFPNFETDDAQSLGTSIPGLVFTFSAILYGALTSLFYFLFITKNSFLAPNLFALLSIILAFALTQNAASSIEKIDFVPSK